MPKNGEYSREHESILRHDESEAERCDSWPQLERVLDASRDCLSNPVNDTRRPFSRKDRLHSKEIGVENRRKDSLLHGDLGRDRKDVGGVVEMVSEEEEPNGCQWIRRSNPASPNHL